MKIQKTAIIGGGINGLYLAWKLSERGHKVIVFEKKKEIGEKACSGLFSEKILGFIPKSKSLVENQINFAFLNFPKKTTRINFSRPFYVMSHEKLDKIVADLAHKSGAKIELNQNISSIPKGFDRVIGTDGGHSFVRKELLLRKPSYRLGILGFKQKLSSLDYVETWPCESGFIWKIPRGKNIEYGIVADSKKAKNVLNDFLEKNNISLEEIKGKIVPHGLRLPKNQSITLCGDAAGLTKSWSGGGVIWGLTAADILLETFPDFLEYRRKVRNFFIPKFFLSEMAVKLVYFIGFNIPFLLPSRVKMESDFLL